MNTKSSSRFAYHVAAKSPARCVLVFVCLLILTCAGCEPSWKTKSKQAFRAGFAAENAANEALRKRKYKTATTLFDKARSAYEEALNLDPYHAGANLQLAQLLARRYNRMGEAVACYARYLDLGFGEKKSRAKAKQQLAFLRDIASGAMENPFAAMDDFLWSVKVGSLTVFDRRVSKQASRGTPAELLKLWQGKLPSASTYQKMELAIYSHKGDLHASVLILVVNGKEKRKYYLDMQQSESLLWEIIGERAVK